MSNIKTILVVDDFRINTILLKQMLSSTPYNVIAVGSGAEALNFIKDNQVDMVLLDIMMPIMNGYEVITAIRNTPETKDLPVIITSALSSRYDEEMAKSKGATDYLEKPINKDDLLQMVEKYLKEE